MTRRRATAAETYRLYYRSTREPVDAIPMHVLALAYRNAWRLRHGAMPAGTHLIDALDLVIEFTMTKMQEQS